MNEQKIRQAFEKWFSDDGLFPKAIERRDDGYKLSTADRAWDVWVAACEFAFSAKETDHV